MTDIELAKTNLTGHSIALVKGNGIITNDERGIKPMMLLIKNDVNVLGYSVADLIVGRAAAFLFVKSGIKAVHANVLSEGGKEILHKFNIPVTWDILTKRIINRRGDDICPMEKAVEGILSADEAYRVLYEKVWG